MTESLPFNQCTLLKLDKLFGLNQIDDWDALMAWLDQPHEISAWEEENLRFFRRVLAHNVHNWNESELIQHFIGPIFTLVDFSDKRFNYFAERRFGGQVDDIEIFGHPDGMVASGYREPEKPFFCFQEYKRHLDPKGDPAGQALGAMLAAQVINEYQHPVYGCYVVGDIWRFMMLQGRTYGMSAAYSATGNGLFDIFRILKVLRRRIVELAE